VKRLGEGERLSASASEGLPAGWVRDENGALRRETIHSMLRRLPGWNYRQPWIYQITFTCADRRGAPLGRVVVREAAGAAHRLSPRGQDGTGSRAGDGASPRGEGAWLSLAEARVAKIAPEAVEAKVELSPLGEAVFALFRRFSEFTPEIRPLYCEIMPEHLHFIVQVVREMKRPLGNAIGGFKTGCEKLFRAAGGEGRLFAEGFQDTILFHAGQLGNMFRYLKDNPRRRAIKALYPELFRVVGEIAVPLRLSPRERDGQGGAGDGAAVGGASREAAVGGASREAAVGGASREAAVGGASRGAAVGGGEAAVGGVGAGVACFVPRATARGWFSALGNRFLLGRPLAQVQVSRGDFGYRREPKPGGGLQIVRDEKGEPVVDFASPGFAEKKTALFAAAQHGAVLISPCVSDGERQVAREALAAGLPLVTLHNKGFSKLQKPSGRYFDACAAGRLLMLAPAAWPYRPGEKKMTRLDATAMNRLCQWIVGEDAAEINYHGMRPENIDALARAAAKVENDQGVW